MRRSLLPSLRLLSMSHFLYLKIDTAKQTSMIRSAILRSQFRLARRSHIWRDPSRSHLFVFVCSCLHSLASSPRTCIAYLLKGTTLQF